MTHEHTAARLVEPMKIVYNATDDNHNNASNAMLQSRCTPIYTVGQKSKPPTALSINHMKPTNGGSFLVKFEIKRAL